MWIAKVALIMMRTTRNLIAIIIAMSVNGTFKVDLIKRFKDDNMEKLKQFIKSESCPKHPKHGDYYYWHGNFFAFAYGEWHIVW